MAPVPGGLQPSSILRFDRGFVAEVRSGRPLTAEVLAWAARQPLLECVEGPAGGATPEPGVLAALARLPRLRRLDLRPAWDLGTEDAFHAARLAWLDALPALPREATVRGLLGVAGDALTVSPAGRFPNGHGHRVELAARLPGLRHPSAALFHGLPHSIFRLPKACGRSRRGCRGSPSCDAWS